MSTSLEAKRARLLNLSKKMALKEKALKESPNRRFELEVGFEMDRSIVERWLARLLKKPNTASLTDEERAFVIHEVWEIIQRDGWYLLGSGEAPRINGFEALNLYPRAILVTRRIPIVGLKNMTVKDAPEVQPGPQEDVAREYLVSQGISSSEYKFHVNLHCIDMF
ncbi:hypothetical protein CPB83DRAFT_853405 [Crepidotus variabilis]|uniref:Uncharacterized protein n=1 Tax=Crepidotus variabilis TaxID=179855 RepID=A0A9P6EGY5_9AGAR|nr:hypothetical protein CPB83DRAFT_853405 [Crepidotus variabilis]